MSKYALQGSFQALSDKRDELAGILAQASELMSTAKGCHLYLVSIDEDDQSKVYITEVWDSKQDHDESLSVPGVRELIGKAMPLLDGPPAKGLELKVIGGI